jgi:hypothetical protein
VGVCLPEQVHLVTGTSASTAPVLSSQLLSSPLLVYCQQLWCPSAIHQVHGGTLPSCTLLQALSQE